MRYLVDTNVISEIRKGRRADSNALKWWASVDSLDIYLSVLSLGEIWSGILALQKRDAMQARILESWLYGVSKLFVSRLVPVDKDSAVLWAEIRQHRTLPMVDSLMVASAIQRNMIFVTRNTRDIHDLGVSYLNPFEN